MAEGRSYESIDSRAAEERGFFYKKIIGDIIQKYLSAHTRG